MQKIKILTAGDSSLLVEFGSEISPEVNQRITATVQLMKEQHIEGVVDLIPAFTSLLVNYDPRVISYEEIRKRISCLVRLEASAKEKRRRILEIPVCYGGEYVAEPGGDRSECGAFPGGGDPDPFISGLSDLYAGISSGICLSGRIG